MTHSTSKLSPGSNSPVGRLAPSPTGALHLGNARTFLLTWLSIRSRGGTLPLRIEDIDGPRVKPEAIDRTLTDLAWLGLDWDGDPILQSTRRDAHEQAIAQLLADGLAYPCTCSRREVEEAASAPHESWMDAATYPGTCRGRFTSREAARAETGREPAVRFRVDVDAVPFTDGFRGVEAGSVRGDFVIAQRSGGPSYQLAVVVDDAAMQVDEVFRADDLLVSTPRQLLLYKALGLRAPARFVHVPLVVGPDGKRLAKRHGDTSLAWFRKEGVSAERVMAFLARTAGLLVPGDDTPIAASDLLEAFDLFAVPRQAVVVRQEDLGSSSA